MLPRFSWDAQSSGTEAPLGLAPGERAQLIRTRARAEENGQPFEVS